MYLWGNFPESEVTSPSIDKARKASVATLFREKGELTHEAVQVLVDVAAQWAGIKISLERAPQNQVTEPRFVGGVQNEDVNVCLCVRGAEFDIDTPEGLLRVPPTTSRDPVCSNSLLRAIAAGASLAKLEFPGTVYPERSGDIALPLPLAAKPDALTLAQKIWARVATLVPGVTLGDHREGRHGHHKPWHSFQSLQSAGGPRKSLQVHSLM